MMNGTYYFMNIVTEEIYKHGFPFICWDTTLSMISLEVRDSEGNKVTENFERFFISREGYYRDLALSVVEKILYRFDKKRYDEPIMYDFRR